jgi:lipopolysaccharide transport system permease protein
VFWQSRAITQRLDLIWTLARTDFKTRYQPTFGGFLWALMKPLAMFVVLMAVFSFIFGSDPSYRLNLIVGLFLWDFFAEATKTGLISLHSKAYLLNKVKFPAWILVLTSASNALITLLLFSTVFVAFLIVSGRAPSATASALFALYVVQYTMMAVGLSLATSVLFLRYRDFNQIWDLVTQAGFFVAPIIYPLSIVPERFHYYLYLWPPTPIIQFSRTVLIDGAIPSFKAHLFLAAESLVIFVIGVLVFRRSAPQVTEFL